MVVFINQTPEKKNNFGTASPQHRRIWNLIQKNKQLNFLFQKKKKIPCCPRGRAGEQPVPPQRKNKVLRLLTKTKRNHFVLNDKKRTTQLPNLPPLCSWPLSSLSFFFWPGNTKFFKAPKKGPRGTSLSLSCSRLKKKNLSPLRSFPDLCHRHPQWRRILALSVSFLIYVSLCSLHVKCASFVDWPSLLPKYFFFRFPPPPPHTQHTHFCLLCEDLFGGFLFSPSWEMNFFFPGPGASENKNRLAARASASNQSGFVFWSEAQSNQSRFLFPSLKRIQPIFFCIPTGQSAAKQKEKLQKLNHGPKFFVC